MPQPGRTLSECSIFFDSRIPILSGVIGETFGVLPYHPASFDVNAREALSNSHQAAIDVKKPAELMLCGLSDLLVITTREIVDFLYIRI
ncbi:hypothetical protein E2G42_23240 [Salmonella enterica subsp. enterica]|nr:hypothetical protein [Salmonella enterica subsp. enterica]